MREGARMSALGQKRTFSEVYAMSALPPEADIRTSPRYPLSVVVQAAWRCWLQSAAPWPDECAVTEVTR
jgi:hypothetical protein